MSLLSDLGLPALVANLTAETAGSPIVITDPTQTFDPTTNTTSGTPVSQTVQATPPARFRADLVNGTSVRTDDLRRLVAAADPGLTFVPEPGHSASWDGVTYRIEDVMTPDADGPVAYVLHLRREGV